MTVDDSGSGTDLYEKLSAFADVRRKELLSQFQPVTELAHSYGRLVARAVLSLGSCPPRTRQEAVTRDLVADVFDFLYEWPKPLFEGRPHVALPLARRAFESLCLLSACSQDAAIAARWDNGKQIENAEIRSALATLPFPESEESMRKLYRFFSMGTHPNRDLVGERFLGADNKFVLGSIGQPELLLILDQIMHYVDLWFWYGAVVGYVAAEALLSSDPSFRQDYSVAAKQAAEIKKWLAESFNQLVVERQAEPPTGHSR